MTRLLVVRLVIASGCMLALSAPAEARFLSKDPVGFAETGDPRMFNRYAYAWNNPTNVNDPTGMDPGDRFKTPQEAGADAVNYINSTSIAENREYGGTIERDVTTTYADDGTNSQTVEYFATDPAQGTGTKSAISVNPDTTVGDYHTHGDYSYEGVGGEAVRINPEVPKEIRAVLDEFDSDNFSNGDREAAANAAGLTADARSEHGENYTSVLGTPSGEIKTEERR